MTYAINQIAKLEGATTRTIRYYDQIGLLKPAGIADNGYRTYDRNSLLALQQIRFFRELEVPLKEIQQIMSQTDFNLAETLEYYREALLKRQSRITRLIQTIDQTLNALKGKVNMSDNDFFAGFDHSAYEEEARQRWGDTSQYAESQTKWSSYSTEQKKSHQSRRRPLNCTHGRKRCQNSPRRPGCTGCHRRISNLPQPLFLYL